MRYTLVSAVFLLSIFVISELAAGDEIRLIDGSVLRGKIIKATAAGVEIEISEDGAVMKMIIPLKKIRTITAN